MDSARSVAPVTFDYPDPNKTSGLFVAAYIFDVSTGVAVFVTVAPMPEVAFGTYRGGFSGAFGRTYMVIALPFTDTGYLTALGQSAVTRFFQFDRTAVTYLCWDYTSYDLSAALFIRANVYDTASGLVATPNLVHVAFGAYFAPYNGTLGRSYQMLSLVYTDGTYATQDDSRAPASQTFQCALVTLPTAQMLGPPSEISKTDRARGKGVLRKPVVRRGIMINPAARQTLAAGYWGQSPKSTMLADQVVERITKSNKDWVRMGVITDLWVPPTLNTDQLPVCGCVKTTNQSADVRCAKCTGLKLIPGYVKWGYNTCFYSAVNAGFTGEADAGFNLPTGIVKNVSTTLHTLALAPGTLSASFQTQDFGVNNPYVQAWELQTLIYNRAPGNSYLVEWSLDRGATWITGDFTGLQLGRGTIRFRITMSRLTTGSFSPQFEILRFRHPIIDEPFIRLAKPMAPRKRSRGPYGVEENDGGGIKFIAVPLAGATQINGQNTFDRVIFPDNCLILLREGTFAGDRYFSTSIEPSEHIGVMTSQLLSTRRVQTLEIFNAIF